MTKTGATRILLADDHGLVRRGLRLILDSEPDLEVAAEAADGRAAVDLATTREIDLAILDLAMPRMTGLQAAREISRRAPGVRLLMLSMYLYDNEQYSSRRSGPGPPVTSSSPWPIASWSRRADRSGGGTRSSVPGS
jgi:DNA-binding NarL/FixJ family response regulator